MVYYYFSFGLCERSYGGYSQLFEYIREFNYLKEKKMKKVILTLVAGCALCSTAMAAQIQKWKNGAKRWHRNSQYF